VEAVGYFADQLKNLLCHLEQTFGKQIPEEKLWEAIHLYERRRYLLNQLLRTARGDSPWVQGSEMHAILDTAFRSDPEVFIHELHRFLTESKPEQNPHNYTLRLLITGAITAGPVLTEMVETTGAQVIVDETCGAFRPFLRLEPEHSPSNPDPCVHLAQSYLSRIPCARMQNPHRRSNILRRLIEEFRIDGIIFHSLKFCDTTAFDFMRLKENLPEVPILNVESEFTRASLSHQRTRVEAFLEMLFQKKFPGVSTSERHRQQELFVAGIDSGSLSTEVVILNGAGEVIASVILRTGRNALESAHQAYEEALRRANIRREDVRYVVATGYGRVSIPFAQETITEITCHARGTRHLFPDVRTIIDIGGQDSKVITLDSKGEVANFAMNDKCAAGTGKFLELTAKALDLALEELGQLSMQSRDRVRISSMCTVFAESEVVSLIAEGKRVEDIVAGLHRAIAYRTAALVRRVKGQPKFVMTGGVAKNQGVVAALEEILGDKVFIPPEPQIVGALGAALLALEKCSVKIPLQQA